ncbi:hypothetical protein [Rhizobium mayense]|uniref:Uncharacterized protein n=1 Tax=Rhizobium mayense TaxID=1312184 RepID=A0ABT7JSB8_9HYPH|nr:hypothetical protein [Rhizobium mayense]MDL2398630.1 hypothetical protein [Rhizobium mayense]
MRLLLLTGDLQTGYRRTEISYTDAEVKNQEVLARALNDRPTEVSYDELAVVGKRLSHDFLLAPKNLRGATGQEFGIEFTSVSYTQHAVPNRVLATTDNVSVWR